MSSSLASLGLENKQSGYITRASSVKDLPPGAILLDEEAILKYRWNVIRDWKPKSQVWPLAYGHHILATVAGLGGIYINHHYRKALKLQHYARMATYFPTVFLPSATAAFFHYFLVSKNILLEKDRCLLCLETRAILCQAVAGGFYPLVLSPVAAFSFADRYLTYALPPLRTNFFDVIGVWKKITMQRAPQIATILMLQLLLSAYVTRQEAYAVHDVLNRAEELESIE